MMTRFACADASSASRSLDGVAWQHADASASGMPSGMRGPSSGTSTAPSAAATAACGRPAAEPGRVTGEDGRCALGAAEAPALPLPLQPPLELPRRRLFRQAPERKAAESRRWRTMDSSMNAAAAAAGSVAVRYSATASSLGSGSAGGGCTSGQIVNPLNLRPPRTGEHDLYQRSALHAVRRQSFACMRMHTVIPASIGRHIAHESS